MNEYAGPVVLAVALIGLAVGICKLFAAAISGWHARRGFDRKARRSRKPGTGPQDGSGLYQLGGDRGLGP